MSLISDALKKAQRARSPDIPGGTSAGIRRSSGVPVKLVVMIAIGAAVFCSVVAVVAISILRRGDDAPAAAAKTAPVAVGNSPATSPAPAPAAPAPTLPVPPPAAPAVVEPASVAAVAASAPAPQAPPATPNPAPAVRGAPLPAPAAAAPPVAAKPEIRIHTFLDDMKVIAVVVRGDVTDRKVMVKIGTRETILRVNDVIDRALNIRLTEIAEDHLTFVDENGVIYTRRN